MYPALIKQCSNFPRPFLFRRDKGCVTGFSLACKRIVFAMALYEASLKLAVIQCEYVRVCSAGLQNAGSNETFYHTLSYE